MDRIFFFFKNVNNLHCSCVLLSEPERKEIRKMKIKLFKNTVSILLATVALISTGPAVFADETTEETLIDIEESEEDTSDPEDTTELADEEVQVEAEDVMTEDISCGTDDALIEDVCEEPAAIDEDAIEVEAASGVQIDSSSFPDDNFRSVVSRFDTDNNGYLSDSEIKAVKTISCSVQQITSLKGLCFFTELETLYAADNSISSIDLSCNKKLKKLDLQNNNITDIDLSCCPDLKKADLCRNPLMFLNIEDNGYLQKAFLNKVKTHWRFPTVNVYYLYSEGIELTVDKEVVVFMASKWIRDDNGKWWYRYSDGTYPKSQWKKLEGNWYYFGSDGYMVTGWIELGNSWYYLAGNGKMTKGWEKIDNRWYYFDDNGVMQTGWEKIGNNWYYFMKTGAMKTGWLKYGGSWYYLYPSSGKMAHDTTVTIDGKKYNFNSDGICTNP